MSNEKEQTPLQVLRNQIRAKTVGAASIFKTKIVEYNGIEIEIKEPTVEAWGEILRKARGPENNDGSDGPIMFSQFLIWSVIYCSYVPEEDTLVFEEADYAVLSKKPKSSFLDHFFDIAQSLMKVETETAEKNLQETADDNSSLLSQKN